MRVLEQEMAGCKYEIASATSRLAVEQDAESAFIGKDSWRNRIADLEQTIENLRNAYAQRDAVLNQMRIDMSSLGVQVQTLNSRNV